MYKKNYVLLLLFLTFTLSILGFFLKINFSKAHIVTASHKETMNFPYFEYTETNGGMSNVSDINIALPSASWNLTQLEVNFTNIELKEELITIEDNPTNFYTIQKFQPLLAVQINITEPTIIYSVDIYAGVTEPASAPVYVQINGYDIPTQKPNNTIIYDPIELNISSTPNWYRQTFSNPTILKAGYYTLVLNGQGVGLNPKPLYRWFNNIENATHPDLLIWTNNGLSWSAGVTNQTFLHRFTQKTTEIFNPKDLDMQIELNGDSYAISNGGSQGTGNVTIKNINFSPEDIILNIPIRINRTVDLNYNFNYYLKLQNQESSNGFVIIDFDKDNIWNATFIINKVLVNYSVKFYCPSNWQHLSIFQNNINITTLANVNLFENTVSIRDETLINGAIITIAAVSAKFNFDLDIRATEFYLEQELKFSIDTPSDGNYTFILYDSLGYPLDNSIQSISYPADTNLFTYYIPSNAKEGEYHAYVYFFDGYNAGVEVTSFFVRIPLIVTILIIVISSALALTGAVSTYVLTKRHKQKLQAKKKAIHDKFLDILNLSHVMISERNSSLNVYEQTFTAKTIDTTLISGFLSAIRSFGIELTNVEDATQTIKLEYKNSKILMSEFKDFRIVLIMNDNPSPLFLESIKKLSFDIEEKYGKLLESFKGNLQPFAGIEELLKINLNTSFLYPLKVVNNKKLKTSQLEKIMTSRALNIMKKRNAEYFYITYLMEEKSFDSKDIEILFTLLEKKVFQPVI